MSAVQSSTSPNDLSSPKTTPLAPNLLGLTPILLFVVLVVATGLLTNDITAMPILVAFFISAGYGLCLNPKGKKRHLLIKFKRFAKAAVIKISFC